MSELKARIKAEWDYIQALLDIDGDCWMGLFTLVIVVRLVLVLKGYAPLTASEAGTYGSAVAAFAYSNRGPRV
jgi:hypothetical protein